MPRSDRFLATIILTLLVSLSFTESPEAEEGGETATEALPPDVIQEPVERAELPSRSQMSTQALKRQLGEQLVEISTGETGFTALHLPANTYLPKGTVILVPGLFEHADASLNISPLRHALADKGWHSLSLNLPDPAFEALHIEGISLRNVMPADNPANAAEQDTGSPHIDEQPTDGTDTQVTNSNTGVQNPVVTPVQQYDTKINQLLKAAIKHAGTTESGVSIMLGQHEGAYWALHYLHQQPDTKPDALVLLNPRYPDSAHPGFASLIEELDTTTVEIYSAYLNQREEEARQRLNAGRRNPGQHYTQTGITARSAKLAQEQVQTKVLGWLHRYHSAHERQGNP